MVNFALFGCGRIGKVHAMTLAPLKGANLVAVNDYFEQAALDLAAEYGARAASVADILADETVHAVIIATPTDTHFDLIRASIAAGKAIFCEKPVDMSADNIRTLKSEVEAARIPFMTAFNRRFDPNFALVADRIQRGEIGEVEMVTILSRDPSPPPVSYIKSSGGIFRDMMIHDLDMARFLLGEEPVEIYATGSALVDPAIGDAGDVDTAVAVLKTASGKVCQISNSRRATYGYDQRVEVHGAKGMLRADNHLENTVEIATAQGFGRAVAQNFFLERYAEAYRQEVLHFVDALSNGEAPSPGINDGLAAQKLADAATLSLETGQPQRIVPE
ncbi:inositol 2-dehydrogenase [Pontivivens insulae]|uniref:Inositol 2-dehydrogenase n=1 Tax=Pontivivens insulae TaxID=1639689 RepID=A0A2R8ACH7_9RHOB|nr:inositol 2-dehydrogenase [Pontivivens insulae]RED13889.1 myo-inositol 2-dehydrogenase [Pontivivens insulae]SPF29963.1 Inositol 2-dehydrogenase [Pontivivens insulae]